MSLQDGIIGFVITYALQLGMAYLRRYKIIRNTIDNLPLLLMDGNTIRTENLKKVSVTEDDLRSKLREVNVLELSQVRAVIMEATGDIAVLHTKDQSLEVEDYILKNVSR